MSLPTAHLGGWPTALLVELVRPRYNRNAAYATETEGATIDSHQQRRGQATRERLRDAARRLFLQRGYLATSVDAILAEAGISSTETLYRHYTSKEDLFVDVLRSMSLEQPRFSAAVEALAAPEDLPSLGHALTTLARDLLSTMSQPDYLALLRILIAEAPRFPELGALYVSAIPQRGLALVMGLLQTAQDRGIIGVIDLEVVARLLLGGLVTYAFAGLLASGDAVHTAPLDRAEAVAQVVLRALACEQ